MKAVKDALHDGFGVAPARVVQSSYEPIQYDETGALCGSQPTLGMDVHPGLKLSRQRLQETADFLRDFLGRLECIARQEPRGLSRRSRDRRRHRLHAGDGPHSRIHQARPVRARSQARAGRRHQHAHAAQARRTATSSSRIRRRRRCSMPITGGCSARRTTRSSPPTRIAKALSLFDILQPAYAGLYSGAIHPTAEAHAIVADHVVRARARAIVGRQDARVKTCSRAVAR